jgi:seryl-tRNA synthetase
MSDLGPAETSVKVTATAQPFKPPLQPGLKTTPGTSTDPLRNPFELPLSNAPTPPDPLAGGWNPPSKTDPPEPPAVPPRVQIKKAPTVNKDGNPETKFLEAQREIMKEVVEGYLEEHTGRATAVHEELKALRSEVAELRKPAPELTRLREEFQAQVQINADQIYNWKNEIEAMGMKIAHLPAQIKVVSDNAESERERIARSVKELAARVTQIVKEKNTTKEQTLRAIAHLQELVSTLVEAGKAHHDQHDQLTSTLKEMDRLIQIRTTSHAELVAQFEILKHNIKKMPPPTVREILFGSKIRRHND